LNNNSLKNSSSGKASTWFLFLILVAAGITGFKFGKAYFDNATLKSEVEEIAERHLLEEAYPLIENIIPTAQMYGINLKPKAIIYNINSRRDQIKVGFSYTKDIDLYVYKYPLKLSMQISKNMAKERNILENFKTEVEGSSTRSEQRKANAIKKAFGK